MVSTSLPTLEELESRLVLTANLAALLASGSNISDYSIDGSGNNPLHTDWGSAGSVLLRTTTAEYGDGLTTAAGEDRPNPRTISNTVNAQTGSILNDRHLTDMVWVWGQFIDHDLDLTVGATPRESLNIAIPTGDPQFDPLGTGTQSMSFGRAEYDPDSGITTPREQINRLTAWLDGSMIYGSDAATAANLRTFQGGRLKTSEGNLLPTDADGTFQAGDIRAAENVALLSMQTLWMREHNYWADRIAKTTPGLSDEAIYQQARARVIAEIQAITYNEFLPALLGQEAIRPYRGFDSEVNPGIANVFSTAAFRVGHTLLSPTLLRLNNDGTPAAEGNLALRDAFFAGQEVVDHGINGILKGAATQRAQEIDAFVIDDVRNFLFGPPGAGGFDLASLNIQRGRDHGLADYNQTRIDLGLKPAATFADISSDPEVQARLLAAYGSVDNIDVWVGALAEDHVPGASVGELIHTVLVDQFTRLRDGDPNWYQNIYTGRLSEALDRTTLADVIERNTGLTSLQDNVFFDPSVLYYRVPAQGGPTRVVVDHDSVDIRNAQGRIVETQSLAQVRQVIIVGAAGTADQVTVDLVRAAKAIEDGIQVHGGFGGGDSLTVKSTPRPDRFTVDGDTVTLNRQQIQYDGLERLVLSLTPGSDTVRLLSAPEARLTLQPEAMVLTPLTKQLFEQLRQDVLRQARQVLTEAQYREFARALLQQQEDQRGPGGNGGGNGQSGPRR